MKIYSFHKTNFTPNPKLFKNFFQGAIRLSSLAVISCSSPSLTTTHTQPTETPRGIQELLAERSKQCKLPDDLTPVNFGNHAIATVRTLSNGAQFAILATHTLQDQKPGEPVKLTDKDRKKYTFQTIFDVPNTDLSFAYNPEDGQRILKALQAEEKHQQKTSEAPLMVARMHTLAINSTDSEGRAKTKYENKINGLTYFQLHTKTTNQTIDTAQNKSRRNKVFLAPSPLEKTNEKLFLLYGFSGSLISECVEENPRHFLASDYGLPPRPIIFGGKDDPAINSRELTSMVTNELQKKGFTAEEREFMTKGPLQRTVLATPIKYTSLIKQLQGSTSKGTIKWADPPNKNKREKLPIEFR